MISDRLINSFESHNRPDGYITPEEVGEMMQISDQLAAENFNALHLVLTERQKHVLAKFSAVLEGVVEALSDV